METGPAACAEPCGRCAAGTYTPAAIFNPVSQHIARTGEIPPCKRYARPCVGAQDFKAAFDSATPIEKAAILAGQIVDL